MKNNRARLENLLAAALGNTNGQKDEEVRGRISDLVALNREFKNRKRTRGKDK